MGGWFGDVIPDMSDSTDSRNQTTTFVPRVAKTLASRKFGTTLTVLGVLLLDLDCDACQSPSRAYLLDVTHPDQHSLGLTTFTSMAGLGGCLGYFLGGIPWENTFLGQILGDHIHVVFTLVWIIYVICMVVTLTASKEPTDVAVMVPNLSRSASRQFLVSSYSKQSINSLNDGRTLPEPRPSSTSERGLVKTNNQTPLPYIHYLRSIVYMPPSLRWLCLTNFFCWMALVSYSLFFTDFVGQAVFGKRRIIIFLDVFVLSLSLCRWQSEVGLQSSTENIVQWRRSVRFVGYVDLFDLLFDIFDEYPISE